MKMRSIIVVVVLFVVLIFGGAILFSSKTPKDIGPCTEYQCDVKLFHFATTIEINKEEEDFATVSGDIFKFVTDPLTMYDLDGNKVAYAGDSYRFIAQDSHTVYVNGSLSAEMVGLFKLFGEAYDIYDVSGNKIAQADFNYTNTYGSMCDMDSNVIADFHSYPFFKDFNVRITEDCPMDEKTVLMIFSSYYSDHSADSNNSD